MNQGSHNVLIVKNILAIKMTLSVSGQDAYQLKSLPKMVNVFHVLGTKGLYMMMNPNNTYANQMSVIALTRSSRTMELVFHVGNFSK